MAKGVFTDQLDDLDDIMPPPIPRPDSPPAASTAPTEPEPEPAPTPAPAAAPTAQPARTVSRATRQRRISVSVPTAEVAPQIHRRLRNLTNREKNRDPITARTYAQVVLDAIEAHQAELSTHWQDRPADDSDDTATGGLFSRRPVNPARRRRHAEPPARVPLTGLNPDDAHMLDQLVSDWRAPSRSALVEEALRLYLKA